MASHSWPYSGLTKPSQDVTVFGDDSEGSTTGSDCEPSQEYEHSQPQTIQHPADKICKGKIKIHGKGNRQIPRVR
jgi:hypothetical protein